MLNLEFKNLTNGDFSEHHVKVDVYLDGVEEFKRLQEIHAED